MPRSRKDNKNGRVTATMEQRPISLKELASRLGLSPATLSIVLNGSAVAETIPQETKDRIFEAAKKFNYRPNYIARSLRAQRTYTVGVVVPEFGDGFEWGRRPSAEGRLFLLRRQPSTSTRVDRTLPAILPRTLRRRADRG